MCHPLRPFVLFLLLFAFLRVAHGQLVNAGFESLTITGEDTLADDWHAESIFGGGVVDQAHGGEHAFGVWNWYYYAKGIARNGSTGRGTPITEVPARLLGWFSRYRGGLQEDQSPNDSAEVSVHLTRWDPIAGAQDTVAAGVVRLGEQAGWAPFQVDIVPWNAEAPDSITVRLLSGVYCFCGAPGNGYCCYLYVDDLQLESGQGVREALPAGDALHVLPEGTGWTLLSNEEVTLPFQFTLRDVSGRIVLNRTISARSQWIAWPGTAGIYVYAAEASDRFVQRGRLLRP